MFFGIMDWKSSDFGDLNRKNKVLSKYSCPHPKAPFLPQSLGGCETCLYESNSQTSKLVPWEHNPSHQMIPENNKGVTVLQIASESQPTLIKNPQCRDAQLWQHPSYFLDDNIEKQPLNLFKLGCLQVETGIHMCNPR